MVISLNQNWLTTDFSVSRPELIIYFVVMFLLGGFAITLHFKANGIDDKKAKWCNIVFSIWTLFIAPLIFSIMQSESIFEAILATISLMIIIFFFYAAICMAVCLLGYFIIWYGFCKKRDDASWFSLDLFWIFGVLTGVLIFYYNQFIA